MSLLVFLSICINFHVLIFLYQWKSFHLIHSVDILKVRWWEGKIHVSWNNGINLVGFVGWYQPN